MDGTPDRGAAEPCGTVREALGAYAIGALEPEEYGPIGAHLAVCSACRAEHDEFAKVAALLSALRPAARHAETGIPHPSARVRAQSSKERHRRDGIPAAADREPGTSPAALTAGQGTHASGEAQ